MHKLPHKFAQKFTKIKAKTISNSLLNTITILGQKKVPNMVTIPLICHFFYTGRIFENQILHQKKRLKAPKTLKMSLKK